MLKLPEGQFLVVGNCFEEKVVWKARQKEGKPAPKYSYIAVRAARCLKKGDKNGV